MFSISKNSCNPFIIEKQKRNKVMLYLTKLKFMIYFCHIISIFQSSDFSVLGNTWSNSDMVPTLKGTI